MVQELDELSGVYRSTNSRMTDAPAQARKATQKGHRSLPLLAPMPAHRFVDPLVYGSEEPARACAQ